MNERIRSIKNKRIGKQILYKSPNQNADYGFDIFDGDEDFDWMIYEIERLMAENSQLKEFIEELKRQMEEELNADNRR
jgi:hypothetical protein